MGFITGGGDAKRRAQQAREEQKVANDRQLAELNANDSKTGFSRRRPRGRRLFADSEQGQLPGNLA